MGELLGNLLEPNLIMITQHSSNQRKKSTSDRPGLNHDSKQFPNHTQGLPANRV